MQGTLSPAAEEPSWEHWFSPRHCFEADQLIRQQKALGKLRAILGEKTAIFSHRRLPGHDCRQYSRDTVWAWTDRSYWMQVPSSQHNSVSFRGPYSSKSTSLYLHCCRDSSNNVLWIRNGLKRQAWNDIQTPLCKLQESGSSLETHTTSINWTGQYGYTSATYRNAQHLLPGPPFWGRKRFSPSILQQRDPTNTPKVLGEAESFYSHTAVRATLESA